MATADPPRALRPQAHRAPRPRATGDGEHGLKRAVGVARPHRAGHRRDHRHRHLRDHRRGDRRLPARRSSSPSRSPGVTCLFSALSYAELASSIPVSGSAYTYGYATLGELVAWIIGWDLILEYGVSVAAVAVGWGGYLQVAAGLAVRHQPARRRSPARPATAARSTCPAVFLVLAVDRRCSSYGVRESARTNTVMVVIKIADPHLLHRRRRRLDQRRQLLAVGAARLQRHGRRRRADLLRLHRLRRDLDVRRGGREPAARPARSRSSARC